MCRKCDISQYVGKNGEEEITIDDELRFYRDFYDKHNSEASQENGWQLCPKCSGMGQLTVYPMSTVPYMTCDVCNGRKIINKITGCP